jgi:surface carbohydrate biosynthesis protein
MKKINILLPVEAISRELDFKLFLAVSLASQNVNVIVAQHDYFNSGASEFEGGFYIGKNIFKSLFSEKSAKSDVDLHFYRELRKNDISLLHLDEEGAIYGGDEKDWELELNARLDPKVLGENEYIFTWGSFQQQYFQRKASRLPNSHVINTGHPKYDLCKPTFRKYFQKDIDEIKAKYGSFILFNTNFDIANGLIGLKDTFSNSNPCWVSYSRNNEQMRIKFVNWWSYQNKTLANFVTLLNKLSIVFPDKTFVLRPHPSEDPAFYETVFDAAKNVYVDKTRAVHPWIMAADVLIHDSCTTAVESYLADTPIINYRSIKNNQYEIKLPNQCGTQCKTEDEVIEAINDLSRDRKLFIKNHSITSSSKSLLKNIESDVYDDFVALVNNLVVDKLANNSCDGNISIVKMRCKEITNLLEQFCRSSIRTFFPQKRQRYATAKVHFSGFDRKVVVENLKVIECMLNKKISLEYLSDRLLVVTGKNES